MSRQSEIIEALAELEHDQWAHWTRYMLDNMSPDNVRRWRTQIKTLYSELSDQEKEHDRVWARKALTIMESYQ